MSRAKLSPEPGWVEISPFPFAAARLSFTGNDPDHDRVALRYFKDEQGELVARVWFGKLSQGAPGRVHGGGVLTALDEAMGGAAWARGHKVMTVRIDAAFRKSVPIETELTIYTKLAREGSRMVAVDAYLMDENGTTFAEAGGDFIKLAGERLREVFGDEA